MGMVCGGVVQVLVQFLDSSMPANLELYREIVATLKSGERAWLITAMPAGFDVPEPITQGLSKGKDQSVGDLELHVVQALTAYPSDRPEIAEYQGRRYLVEALNHEGTVYIFGAGHVSQEVAPLAGLVGFSVVVLDDRQEFANREHFPRPKGSSSWTASRRP